MELLTLQDLCAHLGLDDERTALKVAAGFGFAPRERFGPKDHYRFLWDNLFRFVHGIEPTAHRDIEADLKRPLLHFDGLAASLRKTTEGLRKDVSRGKVILPPAMMLTDRTRAWRLRDIECWIRGEPLPTYVAYIKGNIPSAAEPTDVEMHASPFELEPPLPNQSGGFDPLADILNTNRAIKLPGLNPNTGPIFNMA